MPSEASCLPLRNLWSAIGEGAEQLTKNQPQWVAAVMLVAALIFGWLVLPEPLGAIILGIPLVAILGIFGKAIFWDVGVREFINRLVSSMQGNVISIHIPGERQAGQLANRLLGVLES